MSDTQNTLMPLTATDEEIGTAIRALGPALIKGELHGAIEFPPPRLSPNHCQAVAVCETLKGIQQASGKLQVLFEYLGDPEAFNTLNHAISVVRYRALQYQAYLANPENASKLPTPDEWRDANWDGFLSKHFESKEDYQRTYASVNGLDSLVRSDDAQESKVVTP